MAKLHVTCFGFEGVCIVKEDRTRSRKILRKIERKVMKFKSDGKILWSRLDFDRSQSCILLSTWLLDQIIWHLRTSLTFAEKLLFQISKILRTFLDGCSKMNEKTFNKTMMTKSQWNLHQLKIRNGWITNFIYRKKIFHHQTPNYKGGD